MLGLIYVLGFGGQINIKKFLFSRVMAIRATVPLFLAESRTQKPLVPQSHWLVPPLTLVHFIQGVE